MKAWLKGGLIGLGLSIIARLILEFGNYNVIERLLYFPTGFVFLNYDVVFIMDLVAFIFWFVAGMIMGLIVGKIKVRKN